VDQMTLGIDVACRAAHQASLADERGRFAWTGRRFKTTAADLERLWAQVPAGAAVTVVMEPTRNAWVLLAAWFRRRGAVVILVPPEQSADLRDYYSRHAKSDHLDSRMLARLPLLHPEGLRPSQGLGPADGLRRATKLRASLVKRRSTIVARLDAYLELLGPAWHAALGGDLTLNTPAAVPGRRVRPSAHPAAARPRPADQVHLALLPRRLGPGPRHPATGCRRANARPVARRHRLHRARRRHRRRSTPGAGDHHRHPRPGGEDRRAAARTRPRRHHDLGPRGRRRQRRPDPGPPRRAVAARDRGGRRRRAGRAAPRMARKARSAGRSRDATVRSTCPSSIRWMLRRSARTVRVRPARPWFTETRAGQGPGRARRWAGRGPRTPRRLRPAGRPAPR